VEFTRFDPTFWQTGEAYLIKRGPVKIPFSIIVTGTSMDDYGLYTIKIVDVDGISSINLNTWLTEGYKVIKSMYSDYSDTPNAGITYTHHYVFNTDVFNKQLVKVVVHDTDRWNEYIGFISDNYCTDRQFDVICADGRYTITLPEDITDIIIYDLTDMINPDKSEENK
jgi:hypothetical protein